MFRTYYFSEMPYPYVPPFEFTDVTRTAMPNRWLDPDATYDLYHKYFDIVRTVDEVGLDVMFNEHHETLANLNAAMPLTMAIAARETQKCRILALGNPVANRPDPVRVATEMAMIDVVSHGRLEAGFIKGVHYEMAATNARPTDITARLYEAIDLIVKAWTSHEGPFSWEGEYFHHREVNIVPRPYQQPHPPIWSTATSQASVYEMAKRGFTMATMFNGTEACAKLFATYRDQYVESHGVQPHPDLLAYSTFLFVGDTIEEAMREAPKIQDFLRQSYRILPGQLDVPGYMDPRVRAQIMKMAEEKGGIAEVFRDTRGTANPADLVPKGLAFYGDPDSVFEQLKYFFYAVGGFGNLIGMFQASTMSHYLTEKSLKLFAKEVLPRFRAEVYEPWIKEHGWKRVLLPQPKDGDQADIGKTAGSAITGVSRHVTA